MDDFDLEMTPSSDFVGHVPPQKKAPNLLSFWNNVGRVQESYIIEGRIFDLH